AKLAEREDEGAEPEVTRSMSAVAPVTIEGAIAGTISYMSPEQAQGKKVDSRSDIFSFGAVLYEMITGRRAFTGDSQLSTLPAIVRDDPKPASQIISDLPHELDRIIRRALRKDPARRFQTMADVKVALEELKEELDSGLLAPVVMTERRRPRTVVGIAALAILAGAFAGGHVFFPPHQFSSPAP